MILKKEHANKLVNVVNCVRLIVERGEFSEGDALILFNNSEDFLTIQSNVLNTYRSGVAKKCTLIEFPPRCLMNAVFVDNETVVFSKGI